MRLSLEEWRDLVEPFYDVFADENVPHDGVDIDVTSLDGLLLTKLSSSAQTLVHEPAHRRAVNHDYVLFERFYTGGGLAQVADQDYAATPTRLHAIDMSQRYVSKKTFSRSRGICIPHAMLGFKPGEDVGFASLDLNSPAGRLLSLAHSELFRAAYEPNGEGTTELVETFSELVRRFMLGPRKTESAARNDDLPVPMLIRDFIASNLGDPELGADHLASVFNVSRSTIYRQFEADGGVNRFIRNRRLDRCYDELAHAPPQRGRVAEVAGRWQFFDPTHFNRLFRERFGVAPSRCYQEKTTRSRLIQDGDPHVAHTWLNQLRPN